MYKRSLLRRFIDLVRSDWQWQGTKVKGYGYMRANGKMTYAHRVSYELFVGPIPSGMKVLHSCDDPGCVNPEHLHLGNQSINMLEMFERGRVSRKGIKNGRAKLTESQVLEIRKLSQEGHSQREIARRFNVTHPLIGFIVRREEWRHIP